MKEASAADVCCCSQSDARSDVFDRRSRRKDEYMLHFFFLSLHVYDVRKFVNLKLCLFNNLESDVRLTRTTLRLTMLAGSCRAFIGLLLLVSCA